MMTYLKIGDPVRVGVKIPNYDLTGVKTVYDYGRVYFGPSDAAQNSVWTRDKLDYEVLVGGKIRMLHWYEVEKISEEEYAANELIQS